MYNLRQLMVPAAERIIINEKKKKSKVSASVEQQLLKSDTITE